MDLIYENEFYEIKKACIEVKNILGNGFLEKVYENALKIELENNGFQVERQKELIVKYKNIDVGNYFADLVIDSKILIELKSVAQLNNIHKAQLLNYLKATRFKLGILINFSTEKAGFEIVRIPNFMENISNEQVRTR